MMDGWEWWIEVVFFFFLFFFPSFSQANALEITPMKKLQRRD